MGLLAGPPLCCPETPDGGVEQCPLPPRVRTQGLSSAVPIPGPEDSVFPLPQASLLSGSFSTRYSSRAAQPPPTVA